MCNKSTSDFYESSTVLLRFYSHMDDVRRTEKHDDVIDRKI